MVKFIRWVEAVCDIGDCRWHSDQGRVGDTMMVRQFRDHKASEHSETCKGCRFFSGTGCLSQGESCTNGKGGSK